MFAAIRCHKFTHCFLKDDGFAKVMLKREFRDIYLNCVNCSKNSARPI